MSAGDALVAVRSWFDRVTLASLELPSGPFGGGGRSLYRLTSLEAMGDRLLIELEGQLLLVVTDPGEVLVDREHLVFDQFAQLVFDWQEFGSKRPHAEIYDSGELRFIAQAAGEV
jgi:hypothetical protein